MNEQPSQERSQSQAKQALSFGVERLKMVMVADVEGEIPSQISNGFEKYAHFKTLGEGGKATLVSCKDTNLGRNVVLKKLRPEIADDQLELRRLIREARITAQLQHPATVPLYELGQDDQGQWFFAMKKIEGQTLFEIIVGLARRDAQMELDFDLNRLLNIFTQVGDALSYAHARGVIHRDVKPENIIVGMFGEVTLIDWGAAKVWGMSNDGDEDSRGQRGGTPLYMSPEQVLGNMVIDERTDVFSLGVVLYEMLAQREPFRGRDVSETFDNIVSRQPMSPREAAPHRFIPMPLEKICLKAMEKSPNNRYQSMREFLEAINKYRADALLRASV